MGSKRGKQEESRLQSAAAHDAAEIKSTPLEDHIASNSLNLLKQDASGVDALNNSGFSMRNLYSNALNGQQGERKSDGILTLAGNANPGLAASTKQYLDYKRQQEAAGQLQDNYGRALDSANGFGITLSQLANSRNLGKASLSQNAYQSYAQMQAQKVPLWQRIAGLAVGGLGVLGSLRSQNS